MAWRRQIAVIAAIVAAPVAARADDTTRPVAITYHADAACPDEAAFVQELTSRVAGLRQVDGSATAIEVELSRGPDDAGCA